MINGFEILCICCVEGIIVNVECCKIEVYNSIGVVIVLNLIIGYKNFIKIVKEVLEIGRSVYELVLEYGILNKEELDIILSLENMLKLVKLDIKFRR